MYIHHTLTTQQQRLKPHSVRATFGVDFDLYEVPLGSSLEFSLDIIWTSALFFFVLRLCCPQTKHLIGAKSKGQ